MSHTSREAHQRQKDGGSSVDEYFGEDSFDGLNNGVQSNDCNMNNGDVDEARCNATRAQPNGHSRALPTNGTPAPRRGSGQAGACARTFTQDELQMVKHIAHELAMDIVMYVSSQDRTDRRCPKPSSTHAKTLRRVVDELSDRHRILFKSMVAKLNIEEAQSSCSSFIGIANEIFSDGKYNWGRVATLYAFAGWLAKFCVDNNVCDTEERDEPDNCDGAVQMIGKVAGKYVADNLADWIASQGGWDEMNAFFPEQENLETKVWRGLFYTVVGLGALAATTVAGAVR